jgi:RES domain
MIEVHRIVEDQAKLTSYRATQDTEKAVQLELLIDMTKPPMQASGWHDLVATPFRYDLPVMPSFQARFRPPYFPKNVFYAAGVLETALYEYSYHMMRQRVHLQVGRRRVKNETGTRTGFSVDANDSSALRIHSLPNASAILDRSDYSASHAFIRSNLQATFIVYPSVRDPQHRDNMALMEISHLSHQIKEEKQLNFFYDYKKKVVNWIDLGIEIAWEQVC